MILLSIDNDRQTQFQIRTFLRNRDFSMLEAENSTTGLRVFEQERPDLVILGLDVSDSLIVLAKVKESSPETPVIIMVEKSRQGQIAQALQSGAWDYLFKPLHHDPSVFLHTIGRNLEHAGLIRKNTEYLLNLERVVRENQELQKSDERYRSIFEEKVLREREDHYQSLVANIPVGICRCSPEKDGAFIMANPAMAAMLGYATIEELMQTRPDDLYSHGPEHHDLLTRLYRDGKVLSSELQINRNDGSPLWIALSAYVVKDGQGNPRYIDTLIEDISKRKEAEEKVKHLASFDALTDLPNRSMLLFYLNQAISGARRRSTHGGVIFIDLDRFKIVNDSLGHDTGDILLKKVAERLRRLIRAEDTVARIGSDEFAILFTEVSRNTQETGQKLGRIAEKIRQAISKSFLLAGHELHITASIGIALFSGDADSAEEIVRHASTAVNRCKEMERNRCMFYLPDMQEAADQRLIIEKELRGALERKELQVFFQPQVEASGFIVGAEALVRWEHPERGFIPPMEFIPIAEETGLILSLGEWVLSEACRRMTSWKQQGISRYLRHVAVNISPWQFRQPDFTSLVRRVLATTGAEPSMLIIEITEGVVINDLEDTIAKMQELKAMGIRFSIDDFGTGYSSLSYLHCLPLDQLKIDRSFTQGLAKGSRFASIVSTIIILADNLGLTVIAEGVETITELNFLRENNCATFQGYYFSRPLPPATFQDRLKSSILAMKDSDWDNTSMMEITP